jgi:type II secretory pathway pseudopilin PulG
MKNAFRHPQRHRAGRRNGGFTLFELILVVILLAVSSQVMLGRFLIYQEMAEKAAMEQTAGAVRSGLNIHVAALIARGRSEEIQELTMVNPFTLLADQQKNYAGEHFTTSPADIGRGKWYFDMSRKEMVYLVDHDTHFQSEGQGVKMIRFKIMPVHHEGLLARDSAGGQKELAGITLREVTPYRWDIK